MNINKSSFSPLVMKITFFLLALRFHPRGSTSCFDLLVEWESGFDSGETGREVQGSSLAVRLLSICFADSVSPALCPPAVERSINATWFVCNNLSPFHEANIFLMKRRPYNNTSSGVTMRHENEPRSWFQKRTLRASERTFHCTAREAGWMTVKNHC